MLEASKKQKLKINMCGKRALRDKSAEELIRLAARAAFEHFSYDFLAQLDVRLVDDDAIREINLEYREVDRATDVLSFPMTDFCEGTYIGENILMDIDPESGRIPIGDMLINVSMAKRQAEEYGHSFRRECGYLTVHSILHLLGFDHMDEGKEKARMRKKEEEILEKLGLNREENI